MAGLKKKKDSGLKKTGQFLGNYGKAAADIFLGTAGFKDVIKDEAYKGTGSDFWRKAANINTIGNQVIGSAALAYTGMGGLSGVAFGNKIPQQQLEQPVQEVKPAYIEPKPIVSEADTLEAPIDNYEYLYQQQQNSMYKFKSGGLNQYRTINIEKGELLVNPKTLEILDNYNDAPKHPEGKHEIDIRGNREVPVGMAIIPAKYAEEFKKATPERKKEIINSLPGFNGNPKAQDGLYDGDPMTAMPPINNQLPVRQQQSTMLQSGDPNFDPAKLGEYWNAYKGLTPPADNNGSNIMPYAVAGSTLPALGFGLYQTIAANKALKKLGKEPYAMYNEQVQPELQASYGAAQGRAADAALRSRYGLSQAQQAMYNQNIARDINTRMQRAQDIGGGNVGSVVGTIMNANKIQAAQQQSALDAQLQMQKQQYADRAAQYAEGLAQRISAARQGQQNQNIAFQQQLRLQKERAYGQAKQQGMENMMNAPMQAASILATYYGGK